MSLILRSPYPDTVEIPAGISFAGEVAQRSYYASHTSVALTVDRATEVGTTLLIAIVAVNGSSTRTVTSVADSRGNSYTLDINPVSTHTNGGIARATLSTALQVNDTITITHSGSVLRTTAIAAEFRGLAASPLDTSSTAAALTGTAPNSGNTAVTTQANALLFGYIGWGINATGTPADLSGLTATLTPLTLVGHSNTTTPRALQAAYGIVSATGQYAIAGTLSSSTNYWRASIAAYKGA